MTTIPPSDAIAGQPERTALAWSRTLLAAAALSGFVAVSAWRTETPRAVAVILGLLAAALLLSSSAVARRVWARAKSAVDGSTSAARPRTTLLLAALACGLGVVALLASVLANGGRA